jgi:hypothetical protein
MPKNTVGHRPIFSINNSEDEGNEDFIRELQEVSASKLSDSESAQRIAAKLKRLQDSYKVSTFFYLCYAQF